MKTSGRGRWLACALLATALLWGPMMRCAAQQTAPVSYTAYVSQETLDAAAAVFSDLWEGVVSGFSDLWLEAEPGAAREPSLVAGRNETLRRLLRNAGEQGADIIVPEGAKSVDANLDARRFGLLDRDGNGLLTRDDLSAFWPSPHERLQWILTVADANGDAAASAPEIGAAFGRVPTGVLRQLDRNHDGFISVADNPPPSGDAIDQLRRELAAADIDGNNEVTPGEFAAWRPAAAPDAFARLDANEDGILGGGDLPEAASDSREVLLRWLSEADANGDRMLTREEAQTVMTSPKDRTLFDAMDQSRDGVLSASELPEGPFPASPMERRRLLQRLLGADDNGDGALEYAEIAPVFPDTPAELLTRLDTSADGRVSREELLARLGAGVHPPVDLADVNADSFVDAIDIQLAIKQLSGAPSPYLPADQDGDGSVTPADVRSVTRSVLSQP